MIYFFIFAISFITVYLVTPDIRYAALKLSVIDKRNHRKIHSKVVTNLGGLAVYLGMLGGLAVVAIFDPLFCKMHVSQIGGFLVCTTLILILGIYDDIQGSGALIKFFVQIVIALLLLKIGFRLERITVPGFIDLSLGGLSAPATVLWLVGITNAVNLIDGLDGLATGIAAIASAFFCVYGFFLKENLLIYFSLSLIGATAAFLRYNFYPAKIFLGDTGSLFLGFAIGAIAIYNPGFERPDNPLFLPTVLIMALPILDTIFAIIRRLLKKQNIFRGDSSHIHHYCLKRGLSQAQVAVRFYLITFFLGIISLWVIYIHRFLK